MFKKIATLLLCASSLFALTLEEAISTALKKSPTLKMQSAKSDISKESKRAKKGEFFGSLDFVGSYNSYNIPRTLAPIVPPITPGTVSSKDIASAGLKYDVLLFGGFAQLRDIDIAELGKKLSDTEFKLSKEELVYNIKSLFYKTLALKDRRVSALSYEKALKRLYDDVEREVEFGKKAPVDLLKVESDLEEAKFNIVNIDSSIETLKAKLASLMGVESVGELEGETQTNGLEEIAAIESTYLYKKGMLEVKKSEKGVGKAKALYFPKAALSAYYGSNYGAGESEELWQVGVNFSFSIFDFGKRDAEYQKALIAKQIARLKLENTKLLLKSEIADAKNSIVSAEAKLSSTLRQLRFLKKITEAERVKYEKGASDIYDLLYAEAKLSRAESSLAEARYDLLAARAYLKYLTAGER